MKNAHKILALAFSLIIGKTSFAQTVPAPDSLGLPGDNLNLYGVLYLFKESKNVEEFEQKLNTPDSKINNLDLNHDGQTDYIRVIDYGKNGLHSLVLQDPITSTESQDIAVIEIEQQGNGNAHVQIVGDEDLYGKNYIIEPQDEQQQAQPTQVTNAQPAPVVYVNVWAWPSVQYVYGPSYTYWNSPWYWGYYPHWWSPWRPIGYHHYWTGVYGYRSYYRRGYENHIIAAHAVYYGHRQSSIVVHKNITNNVYHGPRAGGRAVGPSSNGNSGNTVSGPRTGGRAAAPVTNQPKQQSTPKQEKIATQPQAIPKQQAEPRQEKIASKPSMPKQEAAPKQQAMPHNNKGGTRMGGGNRGGGGHVGGGGGHGGGGGRGGRR